jgi:release factor glutamine methyltransferase
VFAEEEAAVLAEAARAGSDLERMVSQRVCGLPLEQIVGWAEFCGLRVAVDAGVFVPRRRTEFLVETAIRRAPAAHIVVDLCCGTGAVGLAIATALSGVELHAADIDPSAVGCARRNLDGIGTVYEGDLFGPLPPALRGRIDLLAVNAPYVPTTEIALMPPEARDHEARVALDGGTDGLDVHRRVAADAATWLAPGGRLLIEISARQVSTAVELLATNGLTPDVVRSEAVGATVVVGATSA